MYVYLNCRCLSASLDPLCKDIERLEKELHEDSEEKRKAIRHISTTASKAREYM